MEHLVRFRSLWSRLSTDERLKVLTHNLDTLDAILFSHYADQLKLTNSTTIHIDYNQIMSEIIENRSSKTKKHINEHSESVINHINITTLSQNLIQNIASFLELASYARFESSNRFIFISIRSVSTLYEIRQLPEQLLDFLKTLSIPQTISFFRRFSNVQYLYIDDPLLLLPNIKWKHVTQLIFDWDSWSKQHIDDLSRFLLSKPFNASILDQLTMCAEGNICPSLAITELLKECDALSSLRISVFLDELQSTHIENMLKIQKFKSLKHISIHCTDNLNVLLQSVSDQLVTLHIEDLRSYPLPVLVNPTGSLSNLRHLMVGELPVDPNILKNLLRNANIDHVTLTQISYAARRMSDNTVQSLMAEVVSRPNLIYLNVQSFEISIFGESVGFFEMIIKENQYRLSRGLLYTLELEQDSLTDETTKSPTDIFCCVYERFISSIAIWTQGNYEINFSFSNIGSGVKWDIARINAFFSTDHKHVIKQQGTNMYSIASTSAKYVKHSQFCDVC